MTRMEKRSAVIGMAFLVASLGVAVWSGIWWLILLMGLWVIGGVEAIRRKWRKGRRRRYDDNVMAFGMALGEDDTDVVDVNPSKFAGEDD